LAERGGRGTPDNGGLKGGGETKLEKRCSTQKKATFVLLERAWPCLLGGGESLAKLFLGLGAELGMVQSRKGGDGMSVLK